MATKMPAFGAPIPEELRPEVERQFRAAMTAAGVEPADELHLEMDGHVHRFEAAGGHPGNRAGAYLLYPDWFPNGWFQDHRRTDTVLWSFDATKTELERATRTASFRADLERQRREREQLWREAQTTAAAEARRAWERARPAEAWHPYLKRKGVRSWGLRVGSDGELLVPMRGVNASLRCIQRIFPDTARGKRFWPGTSPKGAWFEIRDEIRTLDNVGEGSHPANSQPDGAQKTRQPILVCEGYSTAATIWECLTEIDPNDPSNPNDPSDPTALAPYLVAAAGSCWNLAPVCGALRQRHPGRPILVMADDDAQTRVRTGRNPGVAAALDCVRQRLADGVCPPPFSDDDRTQGLTDWNDYATRRGREAAAAALRRALAEARMTDADRAALAARSRLEAVCHALERRDLPRVEMIGGMLPRGHVSVMVAPPGTGKSWLVLRLVSDLSVGGPVLDGFAEGPARRCLVLAGEAGYEMMVRRAAATGWPVDPRNATVVGLSDCVREGLSLDLGTDEGRKNLETLIDLKRPDALFVDSLISFHTLDENKAREMGPLFFWLTEGARRWDVAVALVHHTRKRRLTEQGMAMTQDEAVGSSVLNRYAAQLVGIQPLREGSGLGARSGTGTGMGTENPTNLVRPLKSWFKYFPRFTFRMVDDGAGRVRMDLDLAPEGDGVVPGRERVLGYVRERFEPGEEFRRVELGSCGMADRTLKRALSELVDAGRLERRGELRGTRYWLPDSEGNSEGEYEGESR